MLSRQTHIRTSRLSRAVVPCAPKTAQVKWTGHNSSRNVSARAEDSCAVVDYLLLCKTKAELSEEDVYGAYSEIMSLMYAVPKIVVGFTGPVRSVKRQLSETDESFRHGLHFRLADRQSVEQFMENPAKKKAFKDHLEGITDGYLEVAFTGTVRKDMDAMFRRTDGWETGAEHFVLVTGNTAAEDGSSAEQVQEYTQLLTKVAESEVAGSMQSVAGPIVMSSCNGGSDSRGTVSHVVMSRFASVEEADAYADLPPSVALRKGDSRSPAASELELVFELLAVDGQSTSTGLL